MSARTATARTAGTVAIAAVALMALAACSTPAAPNSAGNAANEVQPAAYTTDTTTPATSARTITVTATGSATGAPDILTVQLGVQTQARTASAALTENNTKANALIASLTGQGIAKKDLATSDLSINPNYNSNGTTITSYQVSNTVTATLRDVTKAGRVIDTAAKAVGDAIRLNQVGFSYDDDSALRSQARTDAVKQAMAQARQLAAAADVTLGPVVSISESDSTTTPEPVYARAAAASDSAAMPILPGEGQLTVSVKVVISIG